MAKIFRMQVVVWIALYLIFEQTVANGSLPYGDFKKKQISKSLDEFKTRHRDT